MENGIMFQAFEWYLPNDGQYYKRMKTLAGSLKEAGFTAVWIPPCCKGTGSEDVGYGIYDLYDLGEFDQKGTVRTKYGTKDDLIQMVQALKACDLQVYADVVMNHKAGADRTETFMAVKVNPQDRKTELEAPKEIEGWTGFDFPGRNGQYSSFKWNFNHFNGVDFNQRQSEKGVFRILGENKGWNLGVSHEHGNYDYLMHSDLDHAHPEVIEELISWAEWLINSTGVDGFRLDALKHIDTAFINIFRQRLSDKFGRDFYMVGEYWAKDFETKRAYLDQTGHKIDLFDVGLHFNFYEASLKGEAFDLRTIFNNSIVEQFPERAVTFVDNHDSQLGQSLESWVEPWFKLHAYALILLREKGYPCVFYGDYFGTGGQKPCEGLKDQIDILMKSRRDAAYGDQADYFEDPNRIGWVRLGTAEHPEKLAVVLSTKEDGVLPMFVGEDQSGQSYGDWLGNVEDSVVIREDGFGEFKVKAGKVSVWRRK